MNAAKHKSEQGQALVLLVFAMIGLIGFAGLSIDGGMMFFERRRAQNAADNAALAAALRKAQGQDYTSEALSVTTQNGYDDDQSTNWVDVNSPPLAGAFAGNSQYVEVVITQTVPTQFIHIVYSGLARLTVRAVAKAVPSTTQPVVSGQALVALDPDDCNALQFHGNGTTTITGGGAFSNSNADPPPASCHSGRATGSSTVSSTGGITLAGDWDPGSASVTGTVTTYADQLDKDDPALQVDEESLNNLCARLPANGAHVQNGGVQTIGAGRYTEIVVRANGSLTMNPGLYCITGGDGFDTAGGTITGVGVLIYLQSGPFETNGNATNILSAPTDANCTSPPAGTVEICDFKGLLLYAAEGNTSTVRINGGAGSTMTGTFYTPDAPIEVTGNSGSFALNSQILGNTVDVGGNGTVTINFDPNDNFANQIPPEIELSE